MARMAVVRSHFVLSVGLLALGIGPALANPDTLLPPSGPITGTFKTLTEVEPRVIVNARNTPGNGSNTFIISQPGSYYLDRNITGEAGKVGIRILANDVTLDLNGFVLQGAAGATNGIVYTGSDRFRLRNGTIRGWPGAGVTFAAGGGFNNLVEDLQVSENTGPGLDLRDGVQVRRVKVEFNGGLAVRLASYSNIADSTIRATAGSGVQLFDGASIRNCYVEASASTAVLVGGQNCTVRDNVVVASGASGKGVAISGSNNVVEGNTITGQNGASTQGVIVNAGTNGLTFRGNVVKGTSDNYALLAGANNQYDLLLSQIPETIDVPANVKLTGSLTAPAGQNGITITADNVNIDLGGHTLTGSGFSSGIVTTAPERRAISIANGVIRGFANGVVLDSSSTTSVRNVTVTGVEGRGIVANFVATVENCQVTGVGSQGIFVSNGSVVRNNVISRAGATAQAVNADGIVVGTDSLVENNAVNLSGGDNIQTGAGSIVRNNSVASAAGRGINAADANLIENNNVRANALDGIAVGFSCKVFRNNVNGNGTAPGSQGGILATGRQNEIVDNHCSFDDVGILITGTRNFIARNTVGESVSANYTFAVGNAQGQTVNVAGAGFFNGIANSGHPQANFDQ